MTGIMPRPRGPMIKDAPDHHDAELVLRLYELRRETTMREARRYLATEFWPATQADLLAVIGGVITSTVLTLVAIPTFYEILDETRHALLGRAARIFRGRRPSPAPHVLPKEGR